jgi:hypothetical protein
MSFSNNQSERNHPRVRAGRAGDPFGIELDVLHALAYPLQDGTTPNLGDYSGSGQGSFCLADGLFDGAGVPGQELLAETGGQSPPPIMVRDRE